MVKFVCQGTIAISIVVTQCLRASKPTASTPLHDQLGGLYGSTDIVIENVFLKKWSTYCAEFGGVLCSDRLKATVHVRKCKEHRTGL